MNAHFSPTFRSYLGTGTGHQHRAVAGPVDYANHCNKNSKLRLQRVCWSHSSKHSLPSSQPSDSNQPGDLTLTDLALRQRKPAHPTSHGLHPARSASPLAGPAQATPEAGASRRGALLQLLAGCTAASAASVLVPAPLPASALPLGPLGQVQRVGGDKLTGLTAQEVAEILRRDLSEGQYFVTGDLTREVFADDCRFVDPTNDVTGLSRYLTALGVLFDPQYSKVELLDIRVTGPRRVEADWRLGGYLVFPWNPKVEPFTGHTVYSLDAEGLVAEQRQTWSISGATALRESFTPTVGPRRQLF